MQWNSTDFDGIWDGTGAGGGVSEDLLNLQERFINHKLQNFLSNDNLSKDIIF